jgi:hypothetical protein
MMSSRRLLLINEGHELPRGLQLGQPCRLEVEPCWESLGTGRATSIGALSVVRAVAATTVRTSANSAASPPAHTQFSPAPMRQSYLSEIKRSAGAARPPDSATLRGRSSRHRVHHRLQSQRRLALARFLEVELDRARRAPSYRDLKCVDGMAKLPA